MPGEPPCFNLPVEAVVYLGLGTNLGDRRENLRQALARLRQLTELEAVSRVYESEPVGYLEQPDFWNLVVRVRTQLEPKPLFHRIKQIERDLGRAESFRNAPRLIDIDILTYDELVQHDQELSLPHPRLHERSFVLLPLADLAPDFRHPESGATLTEMLGSDTMTRAIPVDVVIE
jgi:2-amino-4-hydroxy-6-hydroxymethyldihydropteridine diphosphokinase